MEGCLKHFFAAEKLEHYYCSNCWHIAAIKYLSTTNENEADAVRLGNCSKQDSCDCRNLSRLGALPWSNNFSRTFKQLNIARCPKILCLHLQRASVNVFGELIKFQGHISFPLTLNMNWFMNSGIGIKSRKENLPMWPSKQNCQPPFSFSNHLGMQPDTKRLNYLYRQMENNIFSEAVAPEELRRTTSDVPGNTNVHVSQGQPSSSKTGGCSEINSDNSNTLMQSDEKVSLVVPEESEQVTSDVLSNTNVEDSQGQPSMSEIGGYPDITSHNTLLHSNIQMGGTRDSVPTDLHMYGLVSVVQHFGRSGSGHYTIYRRARGMLKDVNPNERPDSTSVQWFGISDSEVYSVSEEDVLAAEASLLFYERISLDV